MPERLCQQPRQSFIDCMYLHDSCVQSGRAGSFAACWQEIERGEREMPEACAKVYREFLVCRRQMVQFEGLSSDNS